MAAEVTLRDKHATEKRKRILSSAMSLFVDQGYEATTIEQIAASADVSARTVFRYFATKEALLLHDFEERLAKMQELIHLRPVDEGPFDTFVTTICRLVDELDSSPAERDLIVRLLSERPSLRSYQRMTIAEHAERQVIAALAARADLDPDDLGLRAMVAAVSACFDLALRNWLADDTQVRFDCGFRATLRAGAAMLSTSSDAPPP